ncbi:MAG: hypothetical protein KGH94_04550 [Candidatus Micrarchaeota archaeon]|nr:hypothetical protein [Candidatus Micrarchaeota archaeon]
MVWVDNFLDAWEAVEKTVDWRTAKPFTVDALDPYYYDLVIDRILSALDSDAVRGADPRSIFAGPANVRNQMVVILFYSKFYRIPSRDRMRIAEFYRKVLESYSPKDPFTCKGTNKIYSDAEVFGLARARGWSGATPESSRELGKLLVSLASLAYSLYTDATPSLCGEFHGPYDVSERFGRGHTLIVRDYFNLRPHELWRHVKDYRLGSVKIYSIYKDVRIRHDFYGNFVADRNLVDNLAFYKVFMNGRPVGRLGGIKEAREYLAQLTLDQSNRLGRMSLEQMKRKFMETEMLQYKRLFELSGVRPGPTKEMVGRIKNRKLLKGFGVWGQDRILTGKDIKYFREIMDPRTERYYNYKMGG